MTTTINDTMTSLPSEFHHKMLYAMGGLQSDSAFVARQAIEQAEDIVVRMRMACDGFGPPGLIRDADTSAMGRCAEYLSGLIAHTRLRLADKGE